MRKFGFFLLLVAATLVFLRFSSEYFKDRGYDASRSKIRLATISKTSEEMAKHLREAATSIEKDKELTNDDKFVAVKLRRLAASAEKLTTPPEKFYEDRRVISVQNSADKLIEELEYKHDQFLIVVYYFGAGLLAAAAAAALMRG